MLRMQAPQGVSSRASSNRSGPVKGLVSLTSLRTAPRPRLQVLAAAYDPQQQQQGGYYQQQQGAYYPNVPSYTSPAYDASSYAPSAPPTPTPYDDNTYASSGYTEEEQKAVLELESLRQSSETTKNLSFISFWLQFALSIVSAGILLFSVAFVPRVPGAGAVVDFSKYLTLVGVIASFISSLMAHGFLTLSRKLQQGGNVAKSYLVGTLLTNNAICLAGIGITVIGLQASVGTLVAKSLMTAMSGPYSITSGQNTLVSLDVFALQASTNTLLCHVVGLLFTNVMLRIVNRPLPAAKPVTA